MNNPDPGPGSYDPLYGYTQSPARISTAPDITTLTSFHAQSAVAPMDYSALQTYDLYRYPTYYTSYGAAPTTATHLYPEFTVGKETLEPKKVIFSKASTWNGHSGRGSIS